MENQEKENMSEPHVKIFNEEVGSKKEDRFEYKKSCDGCSHSHNRHHIHRGSGVFGLTILFVGVLALLNNLGIVSNGIWPYIIPYWPVLLIFVGVRIILGKSRTVNILLFFMALALYIYILNNALVHANDPRIYTSFSSNGFINIINQ